jgi:hypothetical protein
MNALMRISVGLALAALFVSIGVRAEEDGGRRRSRDVTPDMALFFTNAGAPAVRSEGGVVVSSGRAGRAGYFLYPQAAVAARR